MKFWYMFLKWKRKREKEEKGGEHLKSNHTLLGVPGQHWLWIKQASAREANACTNMLSEAPFVTQNLQPTHTPINKCPDKKSLGSVT